MVLEELGGIVSIVGAIQKVMGLLKELPKDEATQQAQQQLIVVQGLVMESNQQLLLLQEERKCAAIKTQKAGRFYREKETL